MSMKTKGRCRKLGNEAGMLLIIKALRHLIRECHWKHKYLPAALVCGPPRRATFDFAHLSVLRLSAAQEVRRNNSAAALHQSKKECFKTDGTNRECL